jgi:hypothetical protein
MFLLVLLLARERQDGLPFSAVYSKNHIL